MPDYVFQCILRLDIAGSKLGMSPIKSVLIAPVVATFLVTLFMFIAFWDVSSQQFLSAVFTYSFVGSFFAVGSAVIFGWPLSVVFRSLGLQSWWQFAIGGLVCASPFWVAWFYPFDTGHWVAFRLPNSVYFFSVGFLAGILYWWLTIRRRPADGLLKQDIVNGNRK